MPGDWLARSEFLARYLVRPACRRLPGDIGAERYREWAAELAASLEVRSPVQTGAAPVGWTLGAPVIAPAVASTAMITPGQAFPHAPPWRAGLVVMTGYTLVLAITGTALTRRRCVT